MEEVARVLSSLAFMVWRDCRPTLLCLDMVAVWEKAWIDAEGTTDGDSTQPCASCGGEGVERKVRRLNTLPEIFFFLFFWFVFLAGWVSRVEGKERRTRPR